MASVSLLFFRVLVVGGYKRLYNSRPVSSFSRTFCSTGRNQNVKVPSIPSLYSSYLSSRCRGRREFSSSGKENDGDEGSSEGGEEEEGSESEGEDKSEDGEDLGLETLPASRHHDIAPVNIPDNFPEVPILPITRNPLFPRFVKMLEVGLNVYNVCVKMFKLTCPASFV